MDPRSSRSYNKVFVLKAYEYAKFNSYLRTIYVPLKSDDSRDVQRFIFH